MAAAVMGRAREAREEGAGRARGQVAAAAMVAVRADVAPPAAAGARDAEVMVEAAPLVETLARAMTAWAAAPLVGTKAAGTQALEASTAPGRRTAPSARTRTGALDSAGPREQTA